MLNDIKPATRSSDNSSTKKNLDSIYEFSESDLYDQDDDNDDFKKSGKRARLAYIMTILKDRLATSNSKIDDLKEHIDEMIDISKNPNLDQLTKGKIKTLLEMKEMKEKKSLLRVQGGSQKVFYKGYYYKIRTEARSKFILTKHEGKVLLSAVKKWNKTKSKSQSSH